MYFRGKRTIAFLLLFFLCRILVAQDLEKINWKQPVKINGGLNITNTFYQSQGMPARRDPWYWMIGGNLNATVFGVVAVPVSFQFSQQNRSYTQPFNQYGMSPRYKAWTVHAGYRSLQYSTYTVGGSVFLGGGVEYRPSSSPFFVSILYGRFQKGVNGYQSEGLVSGSPAYERWGYGGQVGYQKNGRSVAFQLFRGKDDAGTVNDSVAKLANIAPGMNLVWGIVTKQPLNQHIVVDAEFAMSAYTTDYRGDASDVVTNRYLNGLGSFFQTNTSTKVNNAFQTSINYNQRNYQLKFAYRRVGPQYRTMGSVFLNNDIEDISGGITWKMLQQKMTVSLTEGVQRNNLDHKLTQQAARNAFAGSLMYAPNIRWNFATQYSNFLSNTKFNNTNFTANQLNLQQNSDSIRYNQVTQNASLNSNYSVGDSLVRHGIMATLSWQKARDSRGNNSDFYSGTAGYNITFVPAQLSFNLNILSTFNTSNGLYNQMLGPNVGVSKKIGKALRLSYNASYVTNSVEHVNTGHTLINRAALSVKQGKHHSFNIDLNWMQRKQKNALIQTSSEWRANIIYAYVF